MYDGLVSIVGVIFGILLHHSPLGLIAMAGLGGGISASISMGSGQYESMTGPWHKKMGIALVMGISTLLGTLVPVWGFFLLTAHLAIVVAGVGAFLVATWIGYEKHQGWRGYVKSYAILGASVALTFFCIKAIPASI
jgi:VIT1/CCC1 family predicted Fe2+/Mn2+ transporter